MIKTLIRDWSSDHHVSPQKNVSFRKDAVFLNKITVDQSFINLSTQANPSEVRATRRLSLLSPRSEWIEKPDLEQKVVEKRFSRIFRSRVLPDKLKHFVRRKSCCCKWCGGLSKFELKAKDIAYSDKRFGELSFSSLSSLTKLRSIGKDMVPLTLTQGDGSPKGFPQSAKVQMTKDSILGPLKKGNRRSLQPSSNVEKIHNSPRLSHTAKHFKFIGHFTSEGHGEILQNIQQQPDQNESKLKKVAETNLTTHKHPSKKHKKNIKSFQKGLKNLIHEAGFSEPTKASSPLLLNKDTPEISSPFSKDREKSHDSIAQSPLLPKPRSHKSALRIRKLKLRNPPDSISTTKFKLEDSTIKLSKLFTHDSMSISTARHQTTAVDEDQQSKIISSPTRKLAPSSLSQFIKWNYVDQSTKALQDMRIKTQKSMPAGTGASSPRKIQVTRMKTETFGEKPNMMSNLFQKVYKVAEKKMTTGFGEMPKPFIINSTRTEESVLKSHRTPKLSLKSIVQGSSGPKSFRAFGSPTKLSQLSDRNKIFLADMTE